MKLILLTGFLGSGKTTLLKKLLKEYEGIKFGVLMNEFGETSIDGKLIENEAFDLIELTNGSIFCACLKENFIKGLAEFLNYDLEIVFIESSGVADPSNMNTILDTVTKISNSHYDYLGSICIVDGLYFLEQFDLIPALEKQVRYANEIIVNKTDLQTEEKLKEIREKLNEVNHEARIHQTTFCQIPIKSMVENMTGAKVMNQPSLNSWETRPKTSRLKTKEVLSYENFHNFIEVIKFSAYRIKGFVKTDRGNFELSCVNDFAVMNPWDDEIVETEVVFISSVGIRLISDLHRTLKDHLSAVSYEIS